MILSGGIGRLHTGQIILPGNTDEKGRTGTSPACPLRLSDWFTTFIAKEPLVVSTGLEWDSPPAQPELPQSSEYQLELGVDRP